MFRGFHITRTGIVFVLGIIVLVALVLGGIWLVRERGEQARRQEAVKIAEANLEDQSQTETQPKPEAEASPTPASTETQPKPEAEASPTPASTETQTGTTTVAATGNSTNLPETGPETGPIIVFTLLTLAATYYLSSRRALKRL